MKDMLTEGSTIIVVTHDRASPHRRTPVADPLLLEQCTRFVALRKEIKTG